MNHRRALVGVMAVTVGLTLAWFLWSKVAWSKRASTAAEPAPDARAVSAPATVQISASSIAALNGPHGAIQDDVRLLQEVFVQWQTNFPAAGNPVGTNAEITAALCGDNALNLDLIPRGHPAINARGELCDRWGTPFRFHQNSGTEMQIISAGPDRDFATADDVAVP